jgi:hypothetical protein
MKLRPTTLFGIALWIYFITAIILSVYFNVSWINTFDFLLGVVVTLGLAAWFVIDRIKYPDPSQRKSRWAITRYGFPYRRSSHDCPPHHPNRT